MMMSALKMGGMEIITDRIRTADINNPKGYYEFERVKKLPKGDVVWLESAQGKAVKIISALLRYLPQVHKYRVIFMERDIEEILASQERMLERSGKINESPNRNEALKASFSEHLLEIKAWMKAQNWIDTYYVSYNQILQNPGVEFTKISKFLDEQVDPEAMAEVVDPKLYREQNLEKGKKFE